MALDVTVESPGGDDTKIDITLECQLATLHRSEEEWSHECMRTSLGYIG